MKISKLSPAVGILTLCAGFVSLRAQDNPAQAAARVALEEKMQMAAPPTAGTTTPPVQTPQEVHILVDSSGSVTQEPAVSVPTNQIATPPAAPTIAVPMATPGTPDNEAQATAREALLQQMNQPPAETPVPAKPASAATANDSGKQAGYAPIVAPALPISASQQLRLGTLLNLYKADKITPAAYQRQRAEILAEP
jgi:hypothetical protein